MHRVGALAALALVVVLQLSAVAKQSLVGDAAYHLLAGHQALRYGENRLNLEHPPLVKLVAALPLLGEAPLAPPISVDRVIETSLHLFHDPERLHRVRWASRLLVLSAFGFPFLLAVFFLGRQVAGPRAGAVLALVLGLSISTLPNLSILQTDTAVALGFTATVAAALRYVRRPSVLWAGFLGLGAGLAMAAKFSGVLVLPVVGAALFLARGEGWRERLRDTAVTGVVALGFLGTTYALANHRYNAENGRDTIVRYCRNEALIVGERMKPYEGPLLAVEGWSPGLAQWLTGLVGIRIQNEIGVYPTYAFGELRSQGRWWYFPAVFLVKTPLAVLLATAGALLALAGRVFAGRVLPAAASVRSENRQAARPGTEPALRRWRAARPGIEPALLGMTLAVYLAVAMSSNYNLGVRHLMPILPILYLPAACWTARRRWRSVVLVGVLGLEAVALSPLWMSATNTWWLGRFNPTRFAFSIGDAEYRQNFIALGDAARRHGVPRLHVVYPAVSEEEVRAYLPAAVIADPGERPAAGRWYAVSMTLEQYLPAIPRARPEEVRGYGSLSRLAQAWGPYWREIVERGEDLGYVAGTFHLYHLRE